MPKKIDGIIWQVPPKKLAEHIARYGDRLFVALAAVMQDHADEMAEWARDNARWQDRTGNARQGIFGTAEADRKAYVVTLFVSHAVQLDYPLYLEIANGGKYAIIARAIQQGLPGLKKRIKDMLK